MADSFKICYSSTVEDLEIDVQDLLDRGFYLYSDISVTSVFDGTNIVNLFVQCLTKRNE